METSLALVPYPLGGGAAGAGAGPASSPASTPQPRLEAAVEDARRLKNAFPEGRRRVLRGLHRERRDVAGGTITAAAAAAALGGVVEARPSGGLARRGRRARG